MLKNPSVRTCKILEEKITPGAQGPRVQPAAKQKLHLYYHESMLLSLMFAIILSRHSTRYSSWALGILDFKGIIIIMGLSNLPNC